MSRMKNNLLPAIFLLLCMPTCFAERADRDKPLHLESDQVLMDDVKMTSTFTGNVQLTQGTMLIRGDKIIVIQDKEGFKHGTVYGNPASFRQKREGLDEYVEGDGERIEYDTRTEVVDFYEQSHVKRGLDELRGEHITYNVKTEIFQVNSDGTGSAGNPPKRVRAVLQPKPKSSPAAPDALIINPGNTLSPAK
jgi:lipopolysaccharide export system protein LptA